MSAFIVSRETINAVCSAIFGLRSDVFSHSHAEDKGRNESLDSIGRKFWKLNAEAVAVRYDEPPAVLPTFRYRLSRRRYTTHEQYKALCCLIYQCSEGDIPEKSPVYAEMVKYAERLAHKIVTESPEYAAAEWDLTDRFSNAKVTK